MALSRSGTSSPDVLGPEGDAMYLISSPAPDFMRRQSLMPPDDFQTPHSNEKEPRRDNRASPNKSVHTIRFNDIILPSSPTMRLPRNKQQGLSPTKVQSEGNVSPWKIRVTVEAEQEEENQRRASPRKKKVKSSETITMKVPLKGEESPPSRRRGGRQRKSVSSPLKASPGRTPKTATETNKRRGRPKKSLLEEVDIQDTDGVELGQPGDLTSIVDEAPDLGSPTPARSPVNLESLRSSPSTDDLQADMGRSDDLSPEKASPSEEGHARVVGIETTPTRSLSPTEDEPAASLPLNTLHAGHTPRPRRVYPSPTSPSHVEDHAQHSTGGRTRQSNGISSERDIADPTEEHREFDTIMESEGFSMVSLDTLASAKSGNLAPVLGSARTGLKRSSERQNVNFGEERQNTRSPLSEKPNTSPPTKTQTSQRSSAKKFSEQTPAGDGISSAPPAPAAPSQAPAKKRTLLSLARVVQTGLALQGILKRQKAASKLKSPFSSPQRSGGRDRSEEMDNPRMRLERLFSDFGAETQRELRAGLRFGEQLVQRQIESERLRRNRSEGGEDVGREAVARQPTPVRAPDSARAKREAAWQREREEVSRRIEMAGSDQVIVIDSDADAPQQTESHEVLDDDDDDGDIWQQEARNHESNYGRRNRRAARSSNREKEIKPRDDDPSIQSSVNDMSTRDWATRHEDFPPLGRSRLSMLRDEAVDLSAILRPKDTPNTRQYYAKTPQGSNQRTQPRDHERQDEAQSSPSQARVEQDPAADPTVEEFEQQEDEDNEGEEEVQPLSEHESVGKEPVYTPQATSTPRFSWFHRVTGAFTPALWRTRRQEQEEQPSEPEDAHDEVPDHHQRETSADKQTPIAEPQRHLKRKRDEAADGEEPSIEQDETSLQPPETKKLKSKHFRQRPLALSGYFTDDHYVALKRLYKLAKRSPHRFPYHPTTRREEMIGDWLWTSDGEHGLPITKIQFGIIDEFVHELREAEIAAGGSGEVGWSEDELHKRLFSIIVGEQIRKERKAQIGGFSRLS